MRLKVITLFSEPLKRKSNKNSQSGHVVSSGRLAGHYSAAEQRLHMLCSNHVFTKSLKVVLEVPEGRGKELLANEP